MKRRGFIGAVLSAPIAARVVLQNAYAVTGHGLSIPSRDLSLPEPEPIVLATSMPPVPVTPIQGWVRRAELDMRRDVQPVYSWELGPAPVAHILGPAEVRIELQVSQASIPLDQWHRLQSGKEVRLYIETD